MPFPQGRVLRRLAHDGVLDDRVAEVIDHGCDGECATEPLIETRLRHRYLLGGIREPTTVVSVSRRGWRTPLPVVLRIVYLGLRSTEGEPAARRWLVRYLGDGTPSLRDAAMVTASLAEQEWRVREGLV